MTIVGTRIDNRLLHGMVATNWAPRSGATRVMVVDDHVASDSMLKESMKMGRPAGMAVSIITEETALKNFGNHKYDHQKVYIVAQTPEFFLKLQEQGEDIGQLVLGGTLTPVDDTNYIKVSKRAYIAPDQVVTYHKLLKNGSDILVKYTPNDAEVKLADILK
ncbi:PTS sugar transporter subunit IIB (plasmid) [Lactiplantibacillus plantarum]|uniref:PTS sugar transporter subunit IIB n=1 Tax=Lactiplantibacillus plantarum TaxID=1590 RepID=A0AAX1KDS3_LACPN|nr:PTS sugar transporter subunit IIB [Lactiplantibacillus plantarum]QQM62630.1 PTS sugar transporter subunit IIB [Lactiplantibacillus plantarum]